jgi:alpha-L-fucosidase
VNGEAIYGTRAWDVSSQKTDGYELFFTRKGSDLYIISIGLPASDIRINASALSESSSVTLLGCDCEVETAFMNGSLIIKDPSALKKYAGCSYAYVFKMESDAK